MVSPCSAKSFWGHEWDCLDFELKLIHLAPNLQQLPHFLTNSQLASLILSCTWFRNCTFPWPLVINLKFLSAPYPAFPKADDQWTEWMACLVGRCQNDPSPKERLASQVEMGYNCICASATFYLRRRWWWSPSSLSWVRMASRPQGFSVNPRLASVMRVYVRFCLGYATIGSEQKYNCSSQKDCNAALGNSPPFQLQSFLVISVSSAVNCAKFLTCVRKKLQSPKNCRTSWTFSGGEAFSRPFNLSDPGLTPSMVNCTVISCRRQTKRRRWLN